MKSVKERDSLDLLELVCQLHSRALNQPNNIVMHHAYLEARNEMESRLSETPSIEEGEMYGGWQLCPKCRGNGLLNPPYEIRGTAIVTGYCDVCNGAKIIAKPKAPQVPEQGEQDELWEQMFNFYHGEYILQPHNTLEQVVNELKQTYHLIKK